MAIKVTKPAEWVKKLALQHKVVPLIERAIDQQGEFAWTASFEEKAQDDAWHPSGDCTPTPYELWQKALGLGTERPIDGGLRKIFANGHFWHAYLQEILVRAELAAPEDIERRGMTGWGPVVERGFDHIGPIPWVAWQWATGSMDVANFEVPKHGLAVLDFKTMNSMDFKRSDPPNWCADKWECQLNIYMDWMDLDSAFIVCIDKGTPHNMKEFLYERNQPLIETIYGKWSLVAACLREEVEPDQDFDVTLPLQGPKL